MDKFLELLINNIKQIIITIIYSIIAFVYTFNLEQLNYELIEREKLGDTAIYLIQYNNYQAIYYFFYAIILMAIGMVIIYFTFYELKKYSTDIDIKDIILGILIAILIIFIIIHIFKLITIPILKIIFTVVTIGLGILFSISSNS